MKKIYTISFAIVCAVAVFAVNGQYDVLPKTITPANNTPQYSIFDEEGKPLFDTLYIPAKQWTEYVKFWHTNVDNYTQTSAQQIKGEFSPVDYVGKRQQKDGTFVSDPEGFILENPRDVTTTAYYGYYKLTVRYKYHIEQTRKVDVRQYWKVNYVVKQAPYGESSAKAEGSSQSSWWRQASKSCKYTLLFVSTDVCNLYTTSGVSKGDFVRTDSIEYQPKFILDEVQVFFSELESIDFSQPTISSKPNNTDLQSKMEGLGNNELQKLPWIENYEIPAMIPRADKQKKDCAVNEYTTGDVIWARGSGSQPNDQNKGKKDDIDPKYTELQAAEEKRSYSGTWDDYIYAWAYYLEDENGRRVQDKDINGWIAGEDNILYSEMRGESDVNTLQGIISSITNSSYNTIHFPNDKVDVTNDLSVRQMSVLTQYDTIAQIRHHIHLATPYSINTGYQPYWNYMDTTWYDMSKSFTGKRYTTTAGYESLDFFHEWDEDYATTGVIKQLQNEKNETQYYESTQEARGENCFGVYKMAAKEYVFCHLLPFTQQRTADNGVLKGKSLYVSGSADNLFYTSGDGCGWIELVNAHLYLEDTRLRTKLLTSEIGNFTETKDVSSLSNYNVVKESKGSGAVIYIPDDNAQNNKSYIHIKGKNYLGAPARTGTYQFNLTGTMTMVGQTISLKILYPKVRFNSPIEIRDENVYGTMPPIECTIDDVWKGGSHTNGYIDIASTPWTYGFNARTTLYYNGYRYASALNTGGNHGIFVIESGNVNLWPANGYANDATAQSTIDKDVFKAETGTFSN